MTIDVRLKALWVERVGYRYGVLLGGETIVSGSRDPECDCARVLMARGVRGRFRTIDFLTGRPRMEHDIEKAAGLRTVERDDAGVVVVPYRPMSEEDKARTKLHRTAQGCVGAQGVAADTGKRLQRTGGESGVPANGFYEDREETDNVGAGRHRLENA